MPTLSNSKMADDIETDADQSHPGIGSWDQAEKIDYQTTTVTVSSPSPIDTIVGSLRCLEQQHLVEKATLQKQINELMLKVKRTEEELEKMTEEKDIWLKKCQRMESMMTLATPPDTGNEENRDQSITDDQNSGIKNLEILLQENALLKTKTDSLSVELEQLKISVVSSPSQQPHDVGSAMQPTADDPWKPDQHEMTHHADLSVKIIGLECTDGADDNNLQPGGGGDPVGRRSSPSLSERRGRNQLSLDDSGYPVAAAGGADGGDRRRERSVDLGAVGGGEVFEPDAGDYTPTTEMFQSLANKLGHTEYKPVLRHAKYNDRWFEDIDVRYTKDAQECRFQTLLDWQKKFGCEATVRMIVMAMLKNELRQQAEEFCREYNVYFLILEYDCSNRSEHEEGEDDSDSPSASSPMPLSPGEGGEEFDDNIQPLPPAPEKTPLEKLIGPLMLDQSSFEEEFMQIVEGSAFAQGQVDGFVKDQKWKTDKKIFFQQSLELPGDAPTTLADVLAAWALTVLSIFDSNPHYNMMERRKPVWKLMQSLRKSHSDVYTKIKQEKIFPGGVIGIDAKTGRTMLNTLNFVQHNKMIMKLQQERDDGNDWRGVAAKISGVNQQIITIWKQKGHHKATEATLQTFGTSGMGTVQKLYEIFVELGRGDVAEILEE